MSFNVFWPSVCFLLYRAIFIGFQMHTVLLLGPLCFKVTEEGISIYD